MPMRPPGRSPAPIVAGLLSRVAVAVVVAPTTRRHGGRVEATIARPADRRGRGDNDRAPIDPVVDLVATSTGRVSTGAGPIISRLSHTTSPGAESTS